MSNPDSSTPSAPMTEQQTAATDNALVEKLTFSLRDWKVGDRFHFPSLNALTIHEAAERIKSLLAEVERLEKFQTEVSDLAFKCQQDVLILEADRQRLREALEKHAYVLVEDADGTPTHYAIKAKHREAALNPASKEANDG